MATIRGDVVCRACGVVQDVTMTKKAIGPTPPEREYEVTVEVHGVGKGGLFKAPEPALDATAPHELPVGESLYDIVTDEAPEPEPQETSEEGT